MTANIVDLIRQRLEAQVARSGMTARAISERAKLNAGAVSDILSGRSRNPGLVSLASIAEALGADLMSLLTDTQASLARPPPAVNSPISGKQILLVIGGGIAAYKALDLVRRLRERGLAVKAIMTDAAQRFVTPLSVGALTGGRVFTELFDREAEHDIGHIRLAREADLILVAPATANLLAKMAHGLADDLATTVLLAADRPILVAPAMNPKMWARAATRRNVATLLADGVRFIGPEAGEMAEAGEAGIGRMAEPVTITARAAEILSPDGRLIGRHVVVTSGPTHEPIDPVRYLANRSSGKQGHAIAEAAAGAGARVTLVSGPVNLRDPPGVKVVRVETAAQMLHAVEAALPADVAIMAAAVADWRPAEAAQAKIKKDRTGRPPVLNLSENPDILRTVSREGLSRPRLVVGFAAETDDLLANAEAKLMSKGCDWILANDVSEQSGVMGGDENAVHLISAEATEHWPRMSKRAVAERLVTRIAAALAEHKGEGK